MSALALLALPVAAALAAIGLAAVVRRPEWALVAFVAGDVTNLNLAITQNVHVSPFKPALLVCVVVLLVRVVRTRPVAFPRSPVIVAVVGLFAYMVLTTAVSDVPGSWSTIANRGLSTCSMLVVFALLVETGSTRLVLAVTVAVFAFLAAVSIGHDLVLGNRGTVFGLSNTRLTSTLGVYSVRHSGPGGDVNFWARLLVLAIPLSFSLFAISKRSMRLFWAGSSVALFGGLVLTGSRGTWLASVPAVTVWFVLAGKRYARHLVFLPAVAAPAVIVTGVGARLVTVASIGSSATSGGVDQSLVDRARQTAVAFRMFLDSPILGHGAGTFATLFDHYDRYSSSSYHIPNSPGAHNFYAEQLAEGGIVGLLAWVTVFATACVVGVRTLRKTSCEPAERLLLVGCVSALVGWLGASAFLHLSDLRAPLLVIAAIGAVDVVVRRRPPAAALPRTAGRPTRVLVPVIGVALSGAVLVATAVTAGITTDAPWHTETFAGMAPPRSDDAGLLGYQSDLITRGQLAATVSLVLGRLDLAASTAAPGAAADTTTDGITVQTRLDGSSSGVLILVSGPTPAAATAATPAVLRAAQAAVDGLDTGFRFVIGTTGTAVQDPATRLVPRTVARLLWLLGAIGMTISMGMVVVRLLRRRRPLLHAIYDSPMADADHALLAGASDRHGSAIDDHTDETETACVS